MKNSVENNFRIWNDDYSWPQDGDEWVGHARHCNQPYEAWKQSLLEEFIIPNISQESTLLEIAPGHGRWSKDLVKLCGHLILADISPNCIEHCRNSLTAFQNVTYLVTNGRTLEGVASEQVDLVWSFASFVHMEVEVIESYFFELHRVLKNSGKAIIHHAGRRHAFLWTRFLRGLGPTASRIYQALTMPYIKGDDGWRSDVSRHLVKRLARRCGLTLEGQHDTWGENNAFGVPKYGDTISILRRSL